MKNKSESNTNNYKPSLLFAILAGIALVIFGAAMINLMSMPSFEEKREIQSQKNLEQSLRQAANKAGVSYEEYKRDYDERLRENKKIAQRQSTLRNLRSELIAIFQNKDDLAFDEAIAKIKKDEFELSFSDIYSQIIKNDHHYAFNHVLKAGISCHYNSNTGVGAYTAATNSNHEKYLEQLLEHGCDTSEKENSISLSDLILKSKYRHRVLLLPNIKLKDSVLNVLLLDAIKDGSLELVTSLIERGASPNLHQDYRSPLSASLLNKQPEITILLIENGATVKQSTFVSAVGDGYYKLASEILKREPKYLNSEMVLRRLFASENSKLRNDGIKYLIAQGFKFNKLDNTGIQWLINAIELKDLPLVTILLGQGVDPRKRYKFKTALGAAKSIESENMPEIIKLLDQYNATDDILAMVREEKGIESNENCDLGSKVNYKQGEIANNVLREAEEDTIKANELIKPEIGCSAVSADCINQGFGSDDCIYSVPVCKNNKTLIDSLCCPNEFKEEYFIARCSGLSVRETLNWLDNKF